MSRRPVMTYRRDHDFSVSPSELWAVIGEIDQFETWWPWLEEFRLEGGSLQRGAVLRGVIAPPLPYRMQVQIELTRCDPPRGMEALVHGDLEGDASLELRGDGVGTRVHVAWEVEMMQRPMRLADRMAHPLLQWGHDRVVDMTVAGFRRRLRPSD
jgi:Polyketide cyclase / dehydrase and lipid transport